MINREESEYKKHQLHWPEGDVFYAGEQRLGKLLTLLESTFEQVDQGV